MQSHHLHEPFSNTEPEIPNDRRQSAFGFGLDVYLGTYRRCTKHSHRGDSVRGATGVRFRKSVHFRLDMLPVGRSVNSGVPYE